MAAETQQVEILVTANTQQARTELEKLKGAGAGAGEGLGKTEKSSGAAAYALTNFNRVVQDAPYGIMGVANNIDPLVQSFQKLKAETGSTGGAFKALLGTLAGPTGVLLGINMLVLGIQILPDVFKKVSAAIAGTTEKMQKLTAATKVQGIFSNDSIIKSYGEAKAFSALADELRKTNANSAERKKVIAELNALVPEHTKGVNLHKASEKELSKWIDKTTLSINEKAKAQVVDIFLAPVYQKMADAYAKYGQALDDYTASQKRYNIESVRLLTSGFTAEEVQNNLQSLRNIMQNDNNKLTKAITALNSVGTSDLKSALASGKKFADALFGPDPVIPDPLPENNPAAKEKQKEIKKLAEITIANLMRRTMMNYMSMFAVSKDMDAMPAGPEIKRKLTEGFLPDPFEINQENAPWAKKRDAKFNEMRKEAVERAAIYEDYFIRPFADAFRGEFSKAWNDIFGEATSLFEKFIQGVGEQLFNYGIQKAAFGLLNMIFPGAGDIAAAAGGGSGGGNKPIQIIVDGEVMTTQRMASRTKAILDRTASLR